MGITIMASMLMKAGTFLLVLLRLLIKSYRRASATRNSPKPLKWFFIDPRRGGRRLGKCALSMLILRCSMCVFVCTREFEIDWFPGSFVCFNLRRRNMMVMLRRMHSTMPRTGFYFFASYRGVLNCLLYCPEFPQF